MTATLTPPPAVPWPPASDLVAFRAGLVRFTGADVQRMWDADVLYEDSTVEMLDGLLVHRDCGDAADKPPVPRSDVEAFRSGLVRFTVAQATQLVERGVLPEDASIELLDGLLVRRQCGPAGGDAYVEGDDHNFTVAAFAAAAPQLCGTGCHVRSQSLLILTDVYGPYPDGLILRGPVTAYRGRRPTAADALCVVEVADSSYARDSTEKLAAYAAAGVPQYVIVDLRRRLAEVYAGPDAAAGIYPPPAVVTADGLLSLRVDDDGHAADVPLADLLP